MAGTERARSRPRLPSMSDVAAHAGVSHQTVSRVLNGSPLVREDTRLRVVASIEALGYRRNAAARLLATNRSGRIGLVAAHLALHGPSMIAVGLQEAAHEAGYDVSLLSATEVTPASLRAAVDRLLDEAVEAVVVAVAHRDAQEVGQTFDLPVPLVVVQGVSPGQPMAAGVHQEHGARLATDHLLDLGHRRVAHVTGPLDWIEAGQRRDGWIQAHRERRVLPGSELTGDWSAESGHAAGLLIAEDTDVTAVFAANDAMALGVVNALHEKGRRVPEDVSVVGFDDTPEAAFYWPPLTTVGQDFAALGRSAVALTLRALAGEEGASADLIEPSLVVRSSTARVGS